MLQQQREDYCVAAASVRRTWHGPINEANYDSQISSDEQPYRIDLSVMCDRSTSVHCRSKRMPIIITNIPCYCFLWRIVVFDAIRHFPLEHARLVITFRLVTVVNWIPFDWILKCKSLVSPFWSYPRKVLLAWSNG